MNGKTISTERKKFGNKIIETTIKEIPLYSIIKTQAEQWWNDSLFVDYLIDSKISIFSRTYPWLNNVEYANDSDDAGEVLKQFKKLNKNKDVYVLQEYRHGNSVFYLTPNTDRIDRWDSGIVGFVALPKGINSSLLAKMITDVFEGTVDAIRVINNETNEEEAYYEYWSHADDNKRWNEIAKEIKEQYGCNLEY